MIKKHSNTVLGGKKVINLCTPDRTLKNAKLVMSAKKNSSIVLSCKNYPQGVSPRDRGHLIAAVVLCTILLTGSFGLSIFLFYSIVSLDWSVPLKRLCVLLSTMALCSALFPVGVLLTLGFSKWVPSDRTHSICNRKDE